MSSSRFYTRGFTRDEHRSGTNPFTKPTQPQVPDPEEALKQLDEKQKEHDALLVLRNDKIKELNELEIIVRKYELRISKANEKYTQLEQEIDQNNKELELMLSQADEAEKKWNDLEQQYNDLTKRNPQLEENISVLQQKITELEMKKK